MATDRFNNFEELRQATKIGVDYSIHLREISPIIAIAIHGGGIEIGTSELVEELHYSYGFSRYQFEGERSSNNTELHVTSTNFDEPAGDAAVRRAEQCVSLHGFASDEKMILVGGLDHEKRDRIIAGLNSYGINAKIADRFAGEEEGNIANRCQSGKGVQLEISTAQRKAFFIDGDWSKSKRHDPHNRTEEFYNIVKVIGEVMKGEA